MASTGQAGEGSPASEQLMPGTRLGRYQLLHAIARGGMAVVWAARLEGDRGFNKLVAIKTALPALASSAKFETMFLDEAKLASSIQHPNVCQIFELGEADGVLYMAMEWIHGDSLSNVLRASGHSASLSQAIGARIVADACAGLHAVHELCDEDGKLLHVIHRDISPHNLLVSLQGHVKVADFGIAKSNDQSHHTGASEVKGKLAYMSPEQLTANPLDQRSDIFSMGSVLYEATVGHRPFRGENDARVMYQLLHGDYEPPSKLVPGYSPELEKIVARALATKPKDRFATAEHMRTELERWLAKSGAVVTTAQVAAVVAERLGSIIENRKRKVRAALQEVGNTPAEGSRHSGTRHGLGPARVVRLDSSSDPYVPTLVSQGQDEAPVPGGRTASEAPVPGAPITSVGVEESVDTSALDRAQLPGTITSSITTLGEAQRPTRLPISAKGVALSAMGLLLVAVGVGGIFVARRPPVPVRPSNLVTSAAAVPSAASPAAAPTATSASAAAPATGTERYPGGVGGASNVGPPDVAADVPLALERLPSGATLIVDGVTLPPGSHSVPRPRSGARAHLVVRAPGHKEQTIAFDESTPSPLTVKLAPAAPYDRGTNTGATPLPENPFGTKTSTTTTKEFKNPYQ